MSQKVKYLCRCRSGPLIAPFSGMDYEKMKALAQANREEPAEQRGPELNRRPEQDSRPDWKYPDYRSKERMAA